MARDPPFDLDQVPERIDELPVPLDGDTTGCSCEHGFSHERAEGTADPTVARKFDKWWLFQCINCGGIWWEHNAQADYGDPRIDQL